MIPSYVIDSFAQTSQLRPQPSTSEHSSTWSYNPNRAAPSKVVSPLDIQDWLQSVQASMNFPSPSPYDTDSFAQTSQLRPAAPAASEHGSTWSYNPTRAAPSNAVSSPDIRDWLRSFPGLSARPQGTSQPHSIAELAERAKQILLALDIAPRPLNYWLQIADYDRRDAKSFQEQGDLESAFVEYTKAATIVLNKIPAHPDYRVALSSTKRHDMDLVSYFYPMACDCGPVGCVHISYGSKFTFRVRVLHDFYLI